MLTFLVILVVYLAGVIYTTPLFAQRNLQNYRRDYPSLYVSPEDKNRARSECSGFGLVKGAIWPIAIPIIILVNAVHNRAFANELRAEDALEQAKLYAQARAITEKWEQDQKREQHRSFDKDLNS